MSSTTIAETVQDLFEKEILEGLQAVPKYLPAKYFYDKTGDAIFQEIMKCPEYYPFACEMDIFQRRALDMATAIMQSGTPFDLIELGPGNCEKSINLLRQLVWNGAEFTYIPIDISANIIDFLRSQLPVDIFGLNVRGIEREYLPGIKEVTRTSRRRKVVLFLGSNLGNMPPEEALVFCRKLRCHLKPGDIAIIGIDLKKYPATILAAYNDKKGITKRFNINLLHRINRELNGNIDTAAFGHFAVYDPTSGACKSYLVSRADQQAVLWCEGRQEVVQFARNEEIYMEISQKYTVGQLDQLARKAFFKPLQHLYDSRGWFVDALWLAE